MTRRGKSVWQDDPPFAVGEAKIAPATDEELLRRWEQDAYHGIAQPQDSRILYLITRIKAEREQTIRECIEAVQDYGLKFSSHTDEDAEEALALLIGKKDSPCSIITSVIDKYWDELGWGDRSNNMDWVDKMVADIEAALVKAGLL